MAPNERSGSLAWADELTNGLDDLSKTGRMGARLSFGCQVRFGGSHILEAWALVIPLKGGGRGQDGVTRL